MHRLSWPILLALGLSLAGCLALDSREASRGSEVENELGLYGYLVNEEGKRAVSALVAALPADDSAQDKAGQPKLPAAADSVRTDAAGKYAFTSLAPGRYRIYGKSADGALVVLVPDIAFAGADSPQNVGMDTLRPPGRILAGAEAGGNPREGVMCFVPGTSFLAITDDSGRCELRGLPEGEYTLKYSLSGFAVAKDTGVRVVSGKTTELPRTLLVFDTVGNPPPPTGLRAEYDTLNEVAILRWDSVPVADLGGYYLFRDEGSDAIPASITPRVVKSQEFRDTLSSLFQGEQPLVFTYRLRSVDRGANASLAFSSSVSVNAVPGASIRTRITVVSPATQTFIMRLGDSLRVKVSFVNPSRRVESLTWRLVDEDSILAVRPFSGRQGSDSIVFRPVRLGSYRITCAATDEYGKVVERILPVHVNLEGVPFGGSITHIVSIGDSVRLDTRQFANLRSGFAPAYAWDIGNTGRFIPSPDGNTAFLPTVKADTAIPCILKLAYEDGHVRVAVVWVSVIRDLPVAEILTSPDVFAGDSIFASGERSLDKFGRIVKWEWDLGGLGNYQVTPGPKAVFPTDASLTPEVILVLRVTDDDGMVATRRATIRIHIRDENTWTKLASNGQAAKLGTSFPWVAHGDKVTAIRCVYDLPIGCRNETWSSPDMLTWTKDGDVTGLPEGTSVLPMLSHLGKLWIFYSTNPPFAMHLYSSDDGLRWTEHPLPVALKQRMGFRAAVFKNRIWLAGGYIDSTVGFQQDVWSTGDGTDWTLAEDSAAFGPRTPVGLAVLGDKLWLYGDDVGEDDVWSSPDGKAWAKVAGNISDSHIQNPTFLEHGGKLWVLDGFDQDMAPEEAGIYGSENGSDWKLMTKRPGFARRDGGRFISFKGKLWMVGTLPPEMTDLPGWDDVNGTLGDVWVAPYK